MSLDLPRLLTLQSSHHPSEPLSVHYSKLHVWSAVRVTVIISSKLIHVQNINTRAHMSDAVSFSAPKKKLFGRKMSSP